MMNSQDESLTEGNSNINAMTDVPRRPYRVTVECPLFLIMVASLLMGSAASNIILYRTCVHALNKPYDECKWFLSPIKTNETKDLEQEVQKYSTFVTTVKSVLESLGTAILSLFLGAWSDTYGRRPIITWPLLGMTLSAMLTVIYSMVDSLGPWWYIVTALPTSLSGGFVVLFTGSYCYVSDVSPSDKITLRMTLVDATVSAGMVIGSLITTYLILTIGNTYLMLFATSLYVLAYSYASICIPESLRGALKGGFSKILDPLLVKELTQELFKQRPNRARTQIMLLTIVRIISVFTLYGTSILEYMYTRAKLHWALADYNTYSASSTAIGFFGGFLGILVLQRVLGLSDIIFAILAVCTGSIEFFIKTFAISSWHMYLGSTISMFKGLSSPLIKSHLTKSLPAVDIAKVFAMMCAIEGLVPLFAPVTYTTIYTSTISIFPGIFLFLSGALSVICVVLLGFVKYYSSTQTNFQPLNESEGVFH